ncbi:hypothetical protein [Bradyrhizobium nanningense]|nr:hypothetical protein [Bradyrhizobium nanningense]
MQGKGAASMIRMSFQLSDYIDVVPFLLAHERAIRDMFPALA